MARVFLSYDREDGPKARVIAQALERAGHFVWWDLHIKGGAEYGREIERALEQSDAVVVLWSSRSLQSAWVRDEAAAGRDSGRLIPVLIEPVSPPMGFRQYQNLDFSAWKGRGKSPRMAELLASIEALGEMSVAKPESARAMAASPAPRLPMTQLVKWSLIGGAVMLVLIVLSFVLQRDRSGPGVHTVAVAAADTAAVPLARDLLVSLGQLQSARSGTTRLISQARDGSQAADLIFEAASVDAAKVGASLVLMDGKDRSILWSRDFRQESGNAEDLKQQVAYTAARILGCTLEGLAENKRPLPQHTLKLYLNACADLAELSSADPSPVRPALLQVVKSSPDFLPAWKLLLLVEAEITDMRVINRPDESIGRSEVKQYIAQARRIDPTLAEATLAELAFVPRTDIERRQKLLEQAIARHPDNIPLLVTRSNELRNVGLLSDGIDAAETAVQLDPLSPHTRNVFISALAYAGRIEAAQRELDAAELLWPGTATLRDIRYRFHLRFGDPKIAMKLAPPNAGEGNRLFLTARSDPTVGNVQRFMDYARTRYSAGRMGYLAQALGEFHKEAELYSLLLEQASTRDIALFGDVWFRPQLRRFRQDPRFMQLAKTGGLLDYWRKSGKWPDFCEEPDLPYDCKAEAAKIA